MVLKATGPERDAELYKCLLSSVVILQTADHRRVLEAERRLLESKLARLGDLENLLSAEVTQLDEQIEQIKKTVAIQASAQVEVRNAPAAMTLLLVESELQRNRNRLSNLRERLEVNLKNERVALEGRLSTLQETRSVTAPFQSKEPVGPGASLIVALSAVIGAMLAIFGGFFAEFLGKVRQAEKEDGQT